MSSPFQAEELKDGFLTFEEGVNNDRAPELIPRNQMHDAFNVSIRGDFAHPRSYYQKRALEFLVPSLKATLDAGWFQGACYYKPDIGPELLMVSISGRLYQCEIKPDRAIVTDVTGTEAQLANATQCWMWQAEKWLIWNDGTSKPVFWTYGGPTARSNYGTPVLHQTRNTAAFLVPPVGQEVTVPFAAVAGLATGNIITCTNRGTFSVQDILGLNVTLLNVNATPAGFNVTVPATDNMFWETFGAQLPPGRMGTYGQGRNWMCLTDGKQFVASDAVGGSSGTQAENYRDAVLSITENFYLAGGGNFAVPGSYGEIQAMKFAAVLDASLGQGPLQVFTTENVFSCQAPPDRLTWQDVTNPILTESLIGGGATAQSSTIAANGDTIMRSLDGIRSLVLARKDFQTWGNVPMSIEVSPLLDLDSQDLLPWGSAVVFDNRLLMTAGTVLGKHGAYFQGLIPLNFDPVSSLKGKSPSVYDARVWQGLNAYQILVGRFAKVQRCFAFTFNNYTEELELYEVLREKSTYIADNGITPISWRVETGTLDFGNKDPRKRPFLRLLNGEIWIDELHGKVLFEVYYKPDQWPCWVSWRKFEECAVFTEDSQRPQFRPRLGLGEPSGVPCDNVTNRPLREAYTYRVRLDITGHCILKGAQFIATTIPQPKCAPPVCTTTC